MINTVQNISKEKVLLNSYFSGKRKLKQAQLSHWDISDILTLKFIASEFINFLQILIQKYEGNYWQLTKHA